MIISHRHKFIFIKTPKTAGTSIEIGLSQICGPDDIITPISPEDEATRQQLGYPGPQHYRVPLRKYSKSDWLRLLSLGRRPSFYHHAGVNLIRPYVGDTVWNSYFKFAFERNPWDKAVSAYYWHYRTEPRPSFSEFMRGGGVASYQGFDLYSQLSEVAVDRVFLFEELTDALRDIETKLGLSIKLGLPRAKGKYRKDKRSYREILSPTERERIARMAAREIAWFGYQW